MDQKFGLWDSRTDIYAAAAKSLQSCLTLCDPIDGSSPGFPVPGILQARTLEWVAISFSNIYATMCKIDSWWELAVYLRELTLVKCDALEGCDGEWVAGRFKKVGMYV